MLVLGAAINICIFGLEVLKVESEHLRVQVHRSVAPYMVPEVLNSPPSHRFAPDRRCSREEELNFFAKA